MERKYLLRMLDGPFAEADKYFKNALTTLKKLHERGEVRRTTVEGEELTIEQVVDDDVYWEITDKGASRAGR